MYSLVSDLQYSQLQPFPFFCRTVLLYLSLFWSRTGRSCLLLLRELSSRIPWTVICNIHSCNRSFSFVGFFFCFTSLFPSRTGRSSLLLLRELSGRIPWTVNCNNHSCNRYFSFVGLFCFTSLFSSRTGRLSDCFALPLSFRRGLVNRFFFCGSFPDVFPGQWFAIFIVAIVTFLLSDCFALPLSFRRRLVDRFFFRGSFPGVFPGQWFALFTVATVPFFFSDFFCFTSLSFRRGLVDHVFFFAGAFRMYSLASDLQYSQLQPFHFFCRTTLLYLSLFVEDSQTVSFAGAFLMYSLDSDSQYSQLQFLFFFVGLFCFTSRGLVDRFFCGSFPDVFPGQWFATFTVATVTFLLSDYFALPLSFRRGLVDRFFFCGSFLDVFPGQWFAIFTVATVTFLLYLSLFVEDW